MTSIAEVVREWTKDTNRGINPPEGYWHAAYDLWHSVPEEQRTEFIDNTEPQELIRFLRMMLGNPLHSEQPKNIEKYGIIKLVLNLKPETFMLTEQIDPYHAGLPVWIDLIARMNIGEDALQKEALKLIRNKFYQEPEMYEAWENDLYRYQQRIRELRHIP